MRNERAVTAYEILRLRLLDRIKEGKVDPENDSDGVRSYIKREVADYQRHSQSGTGGRALANPDEMEARLGRAILGYGILEPLLADDNVEEIFISGGDVSYLDANGRLASVEDVATEEEVFHLVNRLLQTSGREVSQRNPIVQARVLDGAARIGVVVPPIADELSVTLRKYTMRHEDLNDLVRFDSITPAAAALLHAAMLTRTGIVVSGIPAAGKTTMVNALIRAVPPSHRVLGCEETRELSAPVMHGAYYQTRSNGNESSGDSEVTLRDLVRICLGMRPDLLVVGEVRGEEAFELTRAGNAGCGVLCTVHSNNAAEALQALTATAIMAGQNVPEKQVRSIFSNVFDLVIHCDREDVQFKTEDSGRIRRQVMEISAVPSLQSGENEYTVEPIFTRESFGAPLRWTGAPLPENLRKRLDNVLTRHGTSVQRIFDGSNQRGANT
ncbi:MAG: CpaF family protein [Acidimicrobiia bacterium]|nr:CpaF family protein [Acidimicrobiia bacterium]